MEKYNVTEAISLTKIYEDEEMLNEHFDELERSVKAPPTL